MAGEPNGRYRSSFMLQLVSTRYVAVVVLFIGSISSYVLTFRPRVVVVVVNVNGRVWEIL